MLHRVARRRHMGRVQFQRFGTLVKELTCGWLALRNECRRGEREADDPCQDGFHGADVLLSMLR